MRPQHIRFPSKYAQFRTILHSIHLKNPRIYLRPTSIKDKSYTIFYLQKDPTKYSIYSVSYPRSHSTIPRRMTECISCGKTVSSCCGVCVRITIPSKYSIYLVWSNILSIFLEFQEYSIYYFSFFDFSIFSKFLQTRVQNDLKMTLRGTKNA